MKRGVFAAILTVLTILGLVSASFAITETSSNLSQGSTVVSFDDYRGLYWKVMSHFTISFWCPENVDIYKVRQKVSGTPNLFGNLISDEAVQKYLRECQQSQFFHYEGKTLNLETQACFDKIADSLPGVDLSTNPKIKKEIIGECYIQENLSHAGNVASLFENRTIRLINSISYEIAHPDETNLLEIKPDSGLSPTVGGRDMLNIRCNREFGDECSEHLPSVGDEKSSNH